MLDTLNKETIMQKRIKTFDDYQGREIAHLNPWYPFRIFARSRYNGDYLRPHEIDIICRFMSHYVILDTLSVSEVVFRLGTNVITNKQTLYDILSKQEITPKNITSIDRRIMNVYCHYDYNFEKTKQYFVEQFYSNDIIEDKINHALEVFGVSEIVWDDDLDKFVYDNYIQHYESYDNVKRVCKVNLWRMGDDSNYCLGDRSRFPLKNRIFKEYEEQYGTDFIIENYYNAFEYRATYGRNTNMLESLKRNEDEIKVEDVQWLVDHKWSLDLIQREMGFSSRYALRRYLLRHHIDFEGCKRKPGRPRGSFKSSSARKELYQDFTNGLVTNSIYDKYKDKYSKRSIDRIYVEWKKDQEEKNDKLLKNDTN
nr:MAG TPA: hypothetical protein [Caudoviricetes sp.]